MKQSKIQLQHLSTATLQSQKTFSSFLKSISISISFLFSNMVVHSGWGWGWGVVGWGVTWPLRWIAKGEIARIQAKLKGRPAHSSEINAWSGY